ncbi:MAG: metalloregulator ArsR/SmtB family transcription factor [Candidatus Omnitrophica bacterium]|nr:metalloregulator ArsR/SmtB family transcription factor [Candidatus Omnitrophota bacterium]
MDKLLKIYKALSDKNRLRILKMLEVRPMCVCELTRVLGITQSSTSEHLKFLKDAGLIKDKKNGYFVDYYLARDTKDRVVKPQFKVIAAVLKDKPAILKDSKKAAVINRNKICKP